MLEIIKIFLVDDNEDFQVILKNLLVFNGYAVIGAAYNGEQALSMYRAFTEKPDLILMDYLIPNKNGLETAKELFAIDPSAKIVGMSGDISMKDNFLSIGALDFLEKPFTIENVIEIVGKLYNRHSNSK